MARVCYEIGNRHAALFIDEHNIDTLLLAMDKPLMLMLEKIGVELKVITSRLVKPLSSSTAHNLEHNH